MTKKNENKYDGWLISNDINKRSLAVFGHFMLGYILVGAVVFIIMIPFVIIAAIISG